MDSTITASTPLNSWNPLSSNRPTLSESELHATAGLVVTMSSSYRLEHSAGEDEEEQSKRPKLIFKKDLLMCMERNKMHFEIDLFRPNDISATIFPPTDLSPLSLYRQLRTLKITGMKESYQQAIWEVVWLNPGLVELTLEMANEPEHISIEKIESGRQMACVRPPPTQRAARDVPTAGIPGKLPIVNLSLTNFIIGSPAFIWFDQRKLREIEFKNCIDAGFRLPENMNGKMTVVVEEEGRMTVRTGESKRIRVGKPYIDGWMIM